MALHPGEDEGHPPEELALVWGLLRQNSDESKDWYRDLVEHSHDLLCVHDLQGRFLSINPVPARLLGYSVKEMLGMRLQDVLDPHYRAQCDAYLLEMARSPEAHGLMSVLRRSGEKRIWEYHSTLRTEGLTTPIVRAIAHDVTERVRAEKALRQTNEKLLTTTQEQERTLQGLTLFRALLDQSNDAIQVIEPESLRFLDVNEKACIDLGYSREALLSMSVFDIDKDIDESWRASVRQRIRESGFALMERVHWRKDGTSFPVEVNCRRVQLDREYCVAVTRDITARKQAEEGLRTGEREQHKTAEQLERERARLIEAQAVAKVGSWETGLPTLDIIWSEQTHRIFETDPSNFHPSRPGFLELVHPEDRAKVNAAFAASLEKGAPSTVEYRIVMADGRVKVLEGRWKVFQDGEGRPARLVGTCQDITEHKGTEEALRQSELHFRTVFQRSPLGIALVEARSGRFLQCNPKYCEIVGREEQELLQLDISSITHGDDIALGNEYQRQLTEEKLASYEFDKRYIRPDGSARWVRILAVAMWNKGETRRCQLALVQDITERRHSEEAIAALVREVCEAKKKLTEEKLYLEQEIDTELGFGEIIGQSKALRDVMEQVGKVASSNATVLLMGETGTGKELVARALHRLSRRSQNSFIKMNCAAIPSGLLESELFGHERGAFTGAVARKIGRLELADKGTLFLDEIGEISLSLQPKLLRVLQDQEFERLGGTQTLKVDFRLIAATNSNLADRVRDHEFRSDLYYRLNVFPIRVPPLRERREDIHLLVEHFVQKFSRRMNRSITSIPRKTMDTLISWHWPGNVRELENYIERSVILTQGSVLVSPLSEVEPLPAKAQESPVDDTLEAAEREHILRALREARGKIGGSKGAAIRLGLKRTTLQSKMKNLGISARPKHP
jgi:PAS domain S-box-containing protein